MKKIWQQILILCAICFCVHAQTINPSVEQYYHSQELMPFVVKDSFLKISHSAFRQVDSGEIIDFSLPLNFLDNTKSTPDWAEEYFIRGNAISITVDGILVQLDKPSLSLGSVVFLKNYPLKKWEKDGDPIFDFAYPSTNYTYKYVAVQGNEATVRCYDYGVDFFPKKVPFGVVRITPVGAMKITITNLLTAKFNQPVKKSINATNRIVDSSNPPLEQTNQPAEKRN
jgi:hypothetical protein